MLAPLQVLPPDEVLVTTPWPRLLLLAAAKGAHRAAVADDLLAVVGVGLVWVDGEGSCLDWQLVRGDAVVVKKAKFVPRLEALVENRASVPVRLGLQSRLRNRD
jgi:hypothetical protein